MHWPFRFLWFFLILYLCRIFGICGVMCPCVEWSGSDHASVANPTEAYAQAGCTNSTSEIVWVVLSKDRFFLINLFIHFYLHTMISDQRQLHRILCLRWLSLLPSYQSVTPGRVPANEPLKCSLKATCVVAWLGLNFVLAWNCDDLEHDGRRARFLLKLLRSRPSLGDLGMLMRMRSVSS